MNRAFVKENDSWNRCKYKMESCMMADEQGECLRDRCTLDPSFVPPKEEAEEKPAAKALSASGKPLIKSLEPVEEPADKAADKAAETPAAKPGKKPSGGSGKF